MMRILYNREFPAKTSGQRTKRRCGIYLENNKRAKNYTLN